MASIPPYLVNMLYALHCVHDDHPCEHGYPSLQLAIIAAHIGMETGALQDVQGISRGDIEIMSAEALRHRISEIAAIPYN